MKHLACSAAKMFEAHGSDTVTKEQIAAAADVAKGTLYNHFPVKEAVLAHWLHLDLAGNLAMLHAKLMGSTHTPHSLPRHPLVG